MLNSNSGNSLIQIVISIGLMSILAVIFASMMESQNKQVKILSEKLLMQEIETSIRSVFLNEDYCSCLFRNKTFDTGNKTWSSGITSLPNSFTNVPVFPNACIAATEKLFLQSIKI